MYSPEVLRAKNQAIVDDANANRDQRIEKLERELARLRGVEGPSVPKIKVPAGVRV